MPKGLAFPAKTDAQVVLADLTYIDNPEDGQWVFAGPYRIPFVLTLIEGPAGAVPEARLFVPTLRLNNWDGEPSLAINYDAEYIRCYMPRDFHYSDDPEDCAYAIINRMAQLLRVEAVRTLRGVLSDMTDLLQALSNLTSRSFVVTCAMEEDGVLQVSSAKTDLIQNTALLIALHFNPYGTSPAQMHRANIEKRDPTQLPQIQPEKDLSAHQRLKDAAKLQGFLEANMAELGLNAKTLKNRLQAIGI